MGVVIRIFFNNLHAGNAKPWWTWAVAAAAFGGIVWLSTFPAPEPAEREASAGPETAVADARFEAAREIVEFRCTMCHGAEPAWEGMATAPKNVHLESAADIRRLAREIYLQAAVSRAMPPGNVSAITGEERRQLAEWYEAGVERR